MTNLHAIVGRLGGQLYAGGTAAIVPGPGHSRRDRSLSLKATEDGRVLYHSFSGDPSDAVRAHLGVEAVEEQGRHRPGPRKSAYDRQRQAEARARENLIRSFCEAVLAGCEPADGSLVETYLSRHRGVTLGADLLFHSSAPWGYEANAGAPAMVAIVRGAGGLPKGLHVTHLRPDGSKIRRTCFGALVGAAVRLQPAGEELAVAEGIETALAFAELHSVPTWAALSTSGLTAFSSPAGVRRLVIAADADDSGTGMAAARHLAERASRRCDVEIRPAPPGQDWNDVLRGVGQ